MASSLARVSCPARAPRCLAAEPGTSWGRSGSPLRLTQRLRLRHSLCFLHGQFLSQQLISTIVETPPNIYRLREPRETELRFSGYHLSFLETSHFSTLLPTLLPERTPCHPHGHFFTSPPPQTPIPRRLLRFTSNADLTTPKATPPLPSTPVTTGPPPAFPPWPSSRPLLSLFSKDSFFPLCLHEPHSLQGSGPHGPSQ